MSGIWGSHRVAVGPAHPLGIWVTLRDVEAQGRAAARPPAQTGWAGRETWLLAHI